MYAGGGGGGGSRQREVSDGADVVFTDTALHLSLFNSGIFRAGVNGAAGAVFHNTHLSFI